VLKPLAGAIVAGLSLTSVLAGVAAGQSTQTYVGMLDRNMSITSGAVNLLSIQRVAATAEDRWLPPSLFDETTWPTRTLGIGYRLGKWLALDLPQDHFLMVLGHEVFGHGSRLREIGARNISYGFDAPLPYGDGGAVTRFDGSLLVSREEALAIDTGGIELQNVLADHIGRQALAAGSIHYREAWLYLESRLDGLRYIRSVSSRSRPGHDIRSFLRDFNLGCEPPACAELTASELKRRALTLLADPLLAYAGYGWAVSNLVQGRRYSALPMIPLPNDVGYLPALRFEMTSYGTAVTSDHAFVHRGRLMNLSVGVGDTGGRRAWTLGVLAAGLVQRARLGADVELAIWRQPSFDAVPGSDAFSTGGLASVTARILLGRRSSAHRLGAVVQVGYKSDGFARGERLDSGPIIRVGMTVQP